MSLFLSFFFLELEDISRILRVSKLMTRVEVNNVTRGGKVRMEG